MANNNKKLKKSESDTPNLISVDKFQFQASFEEDTNNGLYFCNIYIPEEIVILILSHINPKDILNSTLVCRKWCNIIKSDILWSIIYKRHYSKQAKKLPWYIYYSLFATDNFDKNLLKNSNGENEYKHWKIISNGGYHFQIENPPVGADLLPIIIDDFNKTGSFATSYYQYNKLQEISLINKRLLQLILSKYKPHIYVSEHINGRSECGCNYGLTCKLYSKESNNNTDSELLLVDQSKYIRVKQGEGSKWEKVEMIMKDYPSKVIEKIIFQHEGCDTRFWQRDGAKMFKGVVKILFDSIQ